MEDVLEHLGEVDPFALADPASIERLQRQLARLEATLTKAVAAFDASGAWAPGGARTASAWLRQHCALANNEASSEVRRGRQLAHLPHFEAAWAKGEITGAHLDVVASLRREGTEAALARDEEMLLGHASELAFCEFVRVARYWEQHADPDGAEAEAMERRARRDVYLTASIGGTYLGKMTLDPVSGAIVASELQRLERELFEADWAAAHGQLGHEPKAHQLSRTPAQRRADALVEMATRSKSAPAEGRRPAPLFSVLVDYPTLSGRICQLAGGARSVLSPGTLLPWLDQAYVERAVFSPGRRVEVGITSRFFTGATRRAIELRDQGCTHPSCEEPAERCEVDHIVEYSKGGPTTQENGQLLCGFHNRLRNQRPPPGD